MLNTIDIFIVFFTFLFAGCVKGVVGLGLPTVSLGLLAAFFNLPAAMIILLLPSCLTNFWQALAGDHGFTVLKRIWPFLVCATATIWIGGGILSSVNHTLLTSLLGSLLIIYAVLHFLHIRVQIPENHVMKSGILLGLLNGVLTGMTGSFVVPGVMYLQGIGLNKNMLVQAMGMLFSLSTIGLAISLQNNNYINVELLTISAFAVIPALLGMVIGRRIRKSIREEFFLRLFFSSILVLGIAIIVKSLYL